MDTEVQEKKLLKSQAIHLRTTGKTYAQITEKLGIPKSTLSNWLRGLPPSTHQHPQAARLRFLKIQAKGAEANKLLRIKRLKEAEDAIHLSLQKLPVKQNDVLLSLLAMLYWAEGGKNPYSGLIFVNTDPELMLLFLSLLRKCFALDEKRVHLRLHLHDYHNPEEAVKYWSSLLGVPVEQFGKIYQKERSKTKKFRQNFMGICFIQYGDTLIKNKILFAAKEVKKKVVREMV